MSVCFVCFVCALCVYLFRIARTQAGDLPFPFPHTPHTANILHSANHSAATLRREEKEKEKEKEEKEKKRKKKKKEPLNPSMS